jgi:hypothetical protein
MSQQLSISSLFSVLALASLCIMVGFGQSFAGAPSHAPAPALYSIQAELSPGLND